MSSDDEMNNWEEDPVHDARPTKARVQPRKKTKASSPGPSNVHQEKSSLKRTQSTRLDSDADVDAGLVDATAAKPVTKPKPRSKIAAIPNSQQDPKDQGKPASKSTKKHPVAMDVDQEEREREADEQLTTRFANMVASKVHPSDTKYRKELERWKQKTKDLEAQRDALSKQMEELFQIRRTEPEQVLEQLQTQYEERAKTQDALIKELTSQLTRIEPLSRTGQTVALHFLTREAADEEKRAAEQDISRLQEIIKAKDGLIEDKTKRIAELERSVQDAIRERDAEIEKSKELLARAAPKGSPASRSRSTKRPFTLDDPKMTEVIKFYEDMSNLLVTNVKIEHVPDSEEPEIAFHCIYTYYEMTRRSDDIEGERIGEKSIVFIMRIFNGFGGPNDEPASEDDFIHRRIKYTPLHLDKEPEAFVRRLEYMGDSFTFPCAQQGLFLSSLREKIRDAARDVTDSGSDIEGIDVDGQDLQS